MLFSPHPDLLLRWLHQQPTQGDSAFLDVHHQLALDSLARNPHMADPLIRIVQWLFQRPPWVMWGGVILGAVLMVGLLWWLGTHRRAVGHWFATRSTGLLASLAAVVVAGLFVAGFLGYHSFKFVNNDNRFCTGCHIFVPRGVTIARPDTGSYSLVNLLEGKHDTLSCHACHELKPMKEAVKMVYWMSGIRDTTIPPHARVPEDVCAKCHVRGPAQKSWQNIVATAGHRTHLESDSLKGKVECLTCHAYTIHHFVPESETCAQAGCHTDVKIKLGKMAQQTELHCTLCHRFTAGVPALATRDSAAQTLVPNIKQCLACHQMTKLVGEFEPANDPHNGRCGDCHNPHTQTVANQALKTCTTAGCHADWRRVPFHTGATHRAVEGQCETCHVPHAARVDASDCVGCHTRVRERFPSGKFNPPLPFDTTRVLHQAATKQVSLGPASVPSPGRTWTERDPPRGKGDVLPDDAPLAPAPAAPADSFSHARHKKLACITCHDVSSPKRTLTFQRPRGCQICHHQGAERTECRNCHEQSETADSIKLDISIAAAGHPARERPVTFSHPAHDSIPCVRCHVTPVTNAPADSVRSCQACHAEHHAGGRGCTDCHRGETVRMAHQLPVQAHRDCDACHTPATVARLTPRRPLCLTCHQPKQDHYPKQECTTCHFLQSPEAYRSHLQTGGGR